MGGDIGGRKSERVFAHALETLKRDGSNVLFVGDVDAHVHACERLFGETDEDDRYRLVVTAGCSEPSVLTQDERTEHVAFRPDECRVVPETARRVETVDALGTALVEAIADLEDVAGEFDAGQLRVCVDSLEALLEGHSPEAIFRLLHVVTARTQLVDGLGHYHLRRDRSHETVRLFEPLFDVIVEVRTRDGVTEGRWRLRNRNTTSDWLPF